MTRGLLVRQIRETLRQRLWGIESELFNPAISNILNSLLESIRNIDELFVGVSATGFVIILKADDPRLMIRHMRAPVDPSTFLNYSIQSDGSSEWWMTVESSGIPSCRLSFSLPDAILMALDKKPRNIRASAALDTKEQHFSRVTVYRVANEKSMICSLKLSRNRIARARAELRRRGR